MTKELPSVQGSLTDGLTEEEARAIKLIATSASEEPSYLGVRSRFEPSTPSEDEIATARLSFRRAVKALCDKEFLDLSVGGGAIPLDASLVLTPRGWKWIDSNT